MVPSPPTVPVNLVALAVVPSSFTGPLLSIPTLAVCTLSSPPKSTVKVSSVFHTPMVRDTSSPTGAFRVRTLVLASMYAATTSSKAVFALVKLSTVGSTVLRASSAALIPAVSPSTPSLPVVSRALASVIASARAFSAATYSGVNASTRVMVKLSTQTQLPEQFSSFVPISRVPNVVAPMTSNVLPSAVTASVFALPATRKKPVPAASLLPCSLFCISAVTLYLPAGSSLMVCRSEPSESLPLEAVHFSTKNEPVAAPKLPLLTAFPPSLDTQPSIFPFSKLGFTIARVKSAPIVF